MLMSRDTEAFVVLEEQTRFSATLQNKEQRSTFVHDYEIIAGRTNCLVWLELQTPSRGLRSSFSPNYRTLLSPGVESRASRVIMDPLLPRFVIRHTTCEVLYAACPLTLMQLMSHL